ncbi:MAG: ATP-grasp domain-containing protein [Deltaproteobacteria bacterium]|nr:ATP-grasp domain-containing protein [Deltaproteobacteria bacterium]
MEVFITCPSQRDRNALARISGYNCHLLDAKLNPRTPSPELDLLEYIDQCREYIRTHHIDAVFYSRDVADLVAAALGEEFGFRGPSVESVFLCLHKYYSRRCEPAPIRCDYIDLHDGHPSVTTYPCYLKPPWLNLGILGFKLNSPADLQRALAIARRDYGAWSPLYYPFFRRYIDQQKYPLATRDIMLVEEFVDGPQVTVEGWVYEKQAHIWAITDTNTYPSTRVIDNFSLPSRHPAHIQAQLARRAKEAIGNVGLDNGFFNIEFWCHDDSVTLTEINGRAATCFYNLYRNCLRACVYEAGLALACGRNPTIDTARTDVVGGQFNFITFGEDRAEHLLDFARARMIPQLTLYISEGDWVKQVSEFGIVLAQIDLFGRSYEEIRAEAERLRRLLLKQPESSPW